MTGAASTGTLAAPFPYFGGKRRAAPLVWNELGDPAGYVEPFAGSAAVLLGRPPVSGRRTETISDADGWLINAWRAIQLAPGEVAHHAAGPVAEIDYHARLAWLQERRGTELVAWLEGDPEHHDEKDAGWWLYVMACGIGDPFGPGPWRIIDGHLRKLPHLGDAGRGINRELPHLGTAGQGVNRELPHLGTAGRGSSEGDSEDEATRGRASTASSPTSATAHEERLAGYLTALQQRLAQVRIACGDWRRTTTPSVLRAGTGPDNARAVFLDPPYATSGDLYAETTAGISDQVRDWCAAQPDTIRLPGGSLAPLRIILCGYDNEHDALLDHGWTRIEGKAGSGSGYSTRADNGRRERMWCSPACLGHHRQDSLLEAL